MTPNIAHRDAMPTSIDLASVRRDRSVREIVCAWRGLTGGDRTVVACSGGADSTALLLALAASVSESLVVCHVVHDLRARDVAMADCDFGRSLASLRGIDFQMREVCAPEGNAEAGAREVRYRALGEVAMASRCPFVATAHHGDDQFETVLMNMIRGAGLRGMAGIQSARPLGQTGVTLVRPMLRVIRRDSERICELAGVEPRLDATNLDESRVRSALRRGPLKAIGEIRPDASRHVAEMAELLADASRLLDEHVAGVFGDGFSWPRAPLREQSRLVVGEGLRRASAKLTGGAGADCLSKRRVDAAVDAILDAGTNERVFEWPMNVRVSVRSGIVVMKPTGRELDGE